MSETTDLALSDEEIRQRFLAGDPGAIRALKAQVDDFVENDPMLQDFQCQLGEGTNPFGGLRLGGSATWNPVRGKGDWSGWGRFEAWEHCDIVPMKVNGADAIGPAPSGSWVIWDSVSGGTFGFPAPNARQKAEMMALVLNSGVKTRVVPAKGDPEVSALKLGAVMAKVGPEVQRLKQQMRVGHG